MGNRPPGGVEWARFLWQITLPAANPTACPADSSGQAAAPPPLHSASCHLRKEPPCDADAPAIQSMQICRRNWFRGYFRGYLAR